MSNRYFTIFAGFLLSSVHLLAGSDNTAGMFTAYPDVTQNLDEQADDLASVDEFLEEEDIVFLEEEAGFDLEADELESLQ